MTSKISSINFVQEIANKTVRQIQNKYLWRPSSSLASEIKALSPTQIKQFVDSVVSQIMLEKNGLQLIHRLSEIISPERLEAALQPNALQSNTALELLQKEAKYYLEATQENNKPISLQHQLQSSVRRLIYNLERWLDFFGIVEYQNPSEAKEKWQKTTLLLGLYSLLWTTLIPLLTAATSTSITYGIILGLTGMIFLYPYVRPMPYQIPHMTNWTQKYKDGMLTSEACRQENVNTIASELIAHKHLLILGKSGVGKTSMIKTLTEEIAKGTYPELEGKHVFYINAANIEDSDSSTKRQMLGQISACMEGHRENIILVFDEAHSLYQSALADQMKTMLDDPKSHFPYVIAITTDEEYKKDSSAAQSPFANRFKHVEIQPSSREETLKILQNQLLRQAPDLSVEKGALLYLIETAEKYALPATHVLSQCIQKCKESSNKDLEPQIKSLQDKIHSLSFIEEQNEIVDLTRKLNKLETEQSKIKEATLTFFEKRKRLAEIKQQTMRSILTIKNPSQSKEKSEFLILSQIAFPILQQIVQQESKTLNIPSSIDTTLIDQECLT